MFKSRWHYLVVALVAFFLLFAALGVLAAVLIYPNLPSLDRLTDYRPKVPMRIYTADNSLIAEFGEERRAVVSLTNIPHFVPQAILAAEDERFYQHGGVDTLGILRAALSNVLSGGAKEGASTITMQVARNFFLSSEKTFTRKLNEALLAIKIEHTLSKDQILTLYINQIYLGQRAYGFGAASYAYFGKPLQKVSIAEAAMLAGLPKAPSRYNPVVNFERARQRQLYVLHRMHELKYIDDAQYEQAKNQRLVIRNTLQNATNVSADYVAEMVRQAMYDRYQDAIYTSGMKVYTTIRKHDQEAANQALWQGVMDYDQRHGYRGVEGSVPMPADSQNPQAALDDALQNIAVIHDLQPAVVLAASPKLVRAYSKDSGTLAITGAGLKFAQRALTGGLPASLDIRRGALIRVQKNAKTGAWRIVQLPAVEAAFISIDPKTGAIRALVGGFDYNHNKFNHVIQAWRQPGSSFKPFIYSAALEKGFTAATLVEDTPLTIPADQAGGVAWTPKNYEDTYAGIVSVRQALTKSLNLPTIRILQAIGPYYARDYVKRFGFDPARQPPYLTLALGAGSVTPLQLATGYTAFANGGQLVTPYLITRVVDQHGQVLSQAIPEKPHQVIDPRNAFIMTSLMQDVVRRGTAARAMQLGRSDLAGKTGTTNDQRDAWFAGYQPSVVGVAWIGFDQPRSLGRGETGAQAALPIWMKYMGTVLRDVPQTGYTMPNGIVTATINPLTGLPVADGEQGYNEYFYQETVPVLSTAPAVPDAAPATPDAQQQPDSQQPNSSPVF
ncbi:penicillin-binding protein [Sulfuriferula plumbiphila]|uniref:Penicillin-binding protein 1A n=1 Tax=Sulfuriferula plumbiphila TaxID=171865 RepID=A0A512L835_9PROT|nr:penicillin-binding protein 1A [Sulfuriferula plumbiphila]BBP05650.1 penicillin-binding protein [Sulfuriferula plumbiphila]GEP30643.1 penicillin-binding protein [Sulfuriferula plumbiphila]